MGYEIARPIALLIVAVGSMLLVGRYRFGGVLISILIGSAILYAAYHAWPVPTGEWDEDGEEIHYTAPILILIWCCPIWIFASIRNFNKRRKANLDLNN